MRQCQKEQKEESKKGRERDDKKEELDYREKEGGIEKWGEGRKEGKSKAS